MELGINGATIESSENRASTGKQVSGIIFIRPLRLKIQSRRAKMGAKEVKVYSTPTCPWCKKVKKFLDDNGI